MRALRPYQVVSIDAVFREWQTKRSTLLVLATGCGKTYTAADVIKRRLQDGTGRVLWLAHRDELITQARDAIAAHIPNVRIGIEKAQNYANTASLHELHDEVVVASVQTLHAKRRTRFDHRLFGTVIVDEAHHATSSSYREIVDHFPDSKILGLTATPDRTDGTGLGDVFESIAHSYTMRDGISDGYLCDLKLQVIHIEAMDVSTVKTVAGDLNQGQLAEIVESYEALHGVASVLHERMGNRQTIVFCASVKQSKDLCEIIAGYIGPSGKEVRHIDGTTPEETRRRILAEYASGKVQVICNCAVLTEGFDSPSTSLIALARPTKSRSLYTQMVGRGTRLAPGKTDCIVLDFKGNAGRHSLVGPLDLVGRRDITGPVQKILNEWESDGKVLDMDAIEDAKKEHAEKLRKEDEARKVAAQLRATAKYSVGQVDPFDLQYYRASDAGMRDSRAATSKQLDAITKFGMTPPQGMTFRQASDALDRLIKRRTLGLCSYKQSKWMVKAGLPADVSMDDARKIMDYASQNRWAIPEWARVKYGKRVA